MKEALNVIKNISKKYHRELTADASKQIYRINNEFYISLIISKGLFSSSFDIIFKKNRKEIVKVVYKNFKKEKGDKRHLLAEIIFLKEHHLDSLIFIDFNKHNSNGSFSFLFLMFK